MGRKSVSDKKRKVKVGYSISNEINDILNEYLSSNYIFNKSNYIESLVIKDLKEKGILK